MYALVHTRAVCAGHLRLVRTEDLVESKLVWGSIRTDRERDVSFVHLRAMRIYAATV